MQINYTIKTKNENILSFYYGEGKSIYCKTINKNNNVHTKKIIDSCTEFFTVVKDDTDNIFITSKKLDGDISIYKIQNDNTENMVVPLDENIPRASVFFPIFFKGYMSIIYNTSTEQKKINIMRIKTLIQNNKWTNSENIDTLSLSSNGVFFMQNVSKEHIVLTYTKINRNTEIGYKQIKNGDIEDFITIHNTPYQVLDYSSLYFNEEMHFLYIIKGLFSSQIIYRKGGANGISSPIVILDGQKLNSCNISIIGNNIYCQFIMGNSLYYCVSNDGGLSFINTIKYNASLPQSTIKSAYLGENDNNSLINQIYIDAHSKMVIPFIQEFSQKFTYINNQNMLNNDYNNDKGFIKNLNTQFDIDNKSENNNTNNIAKTIPAYREIQDSNTQNKSIQDNINYKNNGIGKNMPTEVDFMAQFDLDKFSKYNIDKSAFNTNIPKAEKYISSGEYIEQTSPVLENRLSALSTELKEKNSQIFKLNETLANKNNENIQAQASLRQRLKELQQENKKLKEDKIYNTKKDGKSNKLECKKDTKELIDGENKK